LIHRFIKGLRFWAEKPILGYFLLGLSAAVALTQVFYLYYNIGDEGDKLATGWLVAKGWVLYKDIFSHHFPLSTLWVAGIVKIFGPSILAVRLSLIFLRTGVLVIAMKASRHYFALGLASLAWSLVGHLYLGNSVIYHSFSGFFILGSFTIGLSLINGPVHNGSKYLFIAGLLLGCAAASDPLMIFPTFAFIVTVSITSISKYSLIQSLKVWKDQLLVVIAGLVTGILPVLLYLLVHDGLQDFFQNAVTFNAQVYSQYSPPIDLKTILKPTWNILDLLNKDWRTYISPFYEWETFEFLDLWIFTGFFYRLIIVLGALALLIRKKPLSALLVYAIGAMVLIRSERYFHASPFVLLSLFIASWLISQGFSLVGSIFGEKKQWIQSLSTGGKIFSLTAWMILCSVFLWLNIRGGKFLIDRGNELGYSTNFSNVAGNAGFLVEATCGLEEARALVYPLDPVQYFLAEIPPASKFHFMTPWVADIAQDQVIMDLEEGLNLVYVNREGNVWGNEVEEYLSEILTFLDGEYVEVEPNYFASPELIIACPHIHEEE
jgi:hypothetical protein